VIMAIVLIILVAIGVIFGSIVVFMIMNKVIRKQMQLLERSSQIGYVLVADLDDPDQVSKATAAPEVHIFTDE